MMATTTPRPLPLRFLHRKVGHLPNRHNPQVPILVGVEMGEGAMGEGVTEGVMHLSLGGAMSALHLTVRHTS